MYIEVAEVFDKELGSNEFKVVLPNIVSKNDPIFDESPSLDNLIFDEYCVKEINSNSVLTESELSRIIYIDLEIPKSLLKLSTGDTIYIGNMKRTDLRSVKFIDCGYNQINNRSTIRFKDCTSLKEIVFPDSALEIPYQAFLNCSSLEKVIMPNDLDIICERAFTNCSSLREIIINSARIIEDEAFFNCLSLEKVVMPNDLDTVCKRAFAKCTSLREIAINSLRIIEDEAFSHTDIAEVVFPDNLEEIWKDIFYDCKSLKGVKLNEGLKTISAYAFRLCALNTIVIPSSVTKIGRNIFDWSPINEIYLMHDEDQLNRIYFVDNYFEINELDIETLPDLLKFYEFFKQDGFETHYKVYRLTDGEMVNSILLCEEFRTGNLKLEDWWDFFAKR